MGDEIMDKVFSSRVWTPAAISPETMIIGFIVLIGIFFLLPYVLRKYYQYQERLRFMEEAYAMALEGEDSSTLQNLVKRYTLNDPVKIFYSLPLFDELVQKEMVRVLRDSYSANTKMTYIDHLYDLRQKMYFEHAHQFNS